MVARNSRFVGGPQMRERVRIPFPFEDMFVLVIPSNLVPVYLLPMANSSPS
jgi:hypothetical protein